LNPLGARSSPFPLSFLQAVPHVLIDSSEILSRLTYSKKKFLLFFFSIDCLEVRYLQDYTGSCQDDVIMRLGGVNLVFGEERRRKKVGKKREGKRENLLDRTTTQPIQHVVKPLFSCSSS